MFNVSPILTVIWHDNGHNFPLKELLWPCSILDVLSSCWHTSPLSRPSSSQLVCIFTSSIAEYGIKNVGKIAVIKEMFLIGEGVWRYLKQMCKFNITNSGVPSLCSRSESFDRHGDPSCSSHSSRTEIIHSFRWWGRRCACQFSNFVDELFEFSIIFENRERERKRERERRKAVACCYYARGQWV